MRPKHHAGVPRLELQSMTLLPPADDSGLELDPLGRELTTAEGTSEECINRDPKGTHGFRCGPVFVPAGDTRTIAELERATKNEIGHRTKAAGEPTALLQDLRNPRDSRGKV